MTVPDSKCSNPVSVQNQMKITGNQNLDNSVLIKPQGVNLKLRPGQSQDVKFTIGQSDQYPVDLYFLFDLSFTMESSRNTLAEQVCFRVTRFTQKSKIHPFHNFFPFYMSTG